MRRVQLIVHLAVGGGLVLLAVLVDYLPNSAPGLGTMQIICLTVGLALVGLGFVPGLKTVSRVSTGVCLSLLTGAIVVLAGEVFFRAIKFDFARQEQAWRRLPPFFRAPNVPTGQVFFRRPGPEVWTGQVLNTFLRQLNVRPNPYGDEQAITVRYNNLGFRNPEDLSDWHVAVAGDSFVELGYLREEEMSTTLLGKALGMKVLNLGVSQTGPLTQLSLLQDYGVSAATRHIVVVFFEGNDLRDLAGEYEALRLWQDTGQRPYREFQKQVSLIKAVPGVLGGFKRLMTPYNALTGYFASAAGEVPVTLSETQHTDARLAPETAHQLDYFLRAFDAFRRNRHLTAWLAYMPSKERVLHGQVRFADGANRALRDWQPGDLPGVIGALCEDRGINFIDLTPALVSETNRTRRLLFNAIYDTHLNAAGSRVVADVMARYLSGGGRDVHGPR